MAHKPWNKKRKVNVSAKSNDQASGNGQDGHARPSKCPHLSKQMPVPAKESPTANNSDREKFLYTLSFDPLYKTLLAAMLTLPVLVSLFIFLMYKLV